MSANKSHSSKFTKSFKYYEMNEDEWSYVLIEYSLENYLCPRLFDEMNSSRYKLQYGKTTLVKLTYLNNFMIFFVNLV